MCQFTLLCVQCGEVFFTAVLLTLLERSRACHSVKRTRAASSTLKKMSSDSKGGAEYSSACTRRALIRVLRRAESSIGSGFIAGAWRDWEHDVEKRYP
jgi:hypothetical protein